MFNVKELKLMHTAAPRSKWIYILPNLFTTLTLAGGFYSIVMSIQGHFDEAAIAIFFAFFADGFDGITARLTNTQSKFGAEYDSFSDLIAFGIAPAFLAYLWSISSMGKYSWLIALFYTVAAAIRLARFNAQLATNEKNYFRGLPSPIAAGMMSSTIYLCNHYAISGITMPYFITVLSVLLSILMVSTLRYYSIRTLDSTLKKLLFITVLLLIIILTVNAHPEGVFCGFLFYIASAIFIYSQRVTSLNERPVTKSTEERSN
jgi:CDP-diacylglycerol--serine O-phosphatidyltransferase